MKKGEITEGINFNFWTARKPSGKENGHEWFTKSPLHENSVPERFFAVVVAKLIELFDINPTVQI